MQDFLLFAELFLFCLQMKSMVEVLGQPHEQLLRVGLYTHYFFSEEKTADGPTWRLMVKWPCSPSLELVKSFYFRSSHRHFCSFRHQKNTQLPTTWSQKKGTASLSCLALWMTLFTWVLWVVFSKEGLFICLCEAGLDLLTWIWFLNPDLSKERGCWI